MKQVVQKSLRIIVQGVLSLAAFAIALLILIQIILIVGINLFNTGKAHDFIEGRINDAILETGYQFHFDQLLYDPVRGFTIKNLRASEGKEVFLTAQTFSVGVDYSKLALKNLSIVIGGANIHLIDLPKGGADETLEETKKDSRLQPFFLPDIFFQTIELSIPQINGLTIGTDVAGSEMIFNPSIKAIVTFSKDANIDLVFVPRAAGQIAGVSFPEKIILKGSITPDSLTFLLEQFDVTSPDYKIHASGAGDLTQSGTIAAQFDASMQDARLLTDQMVESIVFKASINGPAYHPSIDAQGTAVTSSLKERGLADIKFSAKTQDIAEVLKGSVSFETSYKDEPISLSATISYEDPALVIEDLKGMAPFVDIKGAGKMVDTLFNGKLSVSATNLAHYKDLAGIDIAGALRADAVFTAPEGKQALDLNAVLTKMRFDSMSLAQADIKAGFSDLNTPWPHQADILLSGLVAAEDVSFKQAVITLKKNQGDGYQLALHGSGHVMAPMSFKGAAALSDLTQAIPSIHDADLKATFGQSSVRLTGSMDENAVDLKLSTKGFKASDIPADLPDAMSAIIITGDVGLTGLPAKPLTKTSLNIKGLNTGKYQGLAIDIGAVHQNDVASVTVAGKGAGIRTLQAAASFPMTFALMPFAFDLPKTGALDGVFKGDLDVAALSALFLPPTQEVSGRVTMDAILGGMLGSPEAAGNVLLNSGNFKDEGNGIFLANISANGRFTKDTLTVTTLQATDGEEGALSGNGDINFGPDGHTNLSVSMKNFHLPKSDLADGILNADIRMKDNAAGYAVEGTIDIAHMNILVPETFQNNIPELNIIERKTKADENKTAQSIILAMKINAPNQIFVRGWGLDAEFGGEVDISGTADAPQFNGNLSSKRGRYEEFGKRFTLAHANLRFQGDLPPSPYLDIEATTQSNDITASVLLTGPVTSPSIGFSSSPSLPEDEVLSHILFGRDSSRISPFQAVQLAQTVRRFSGQGGGGLDPLGMIRSATGLDDITVETDESGETSVGVGKYLTDKVYLEAEKGKGADSGAAKIQIEVTPSINVESKIGQDAEAGGGVFWRRDY